VTSTQVKISEALRTRSHRILEYDRWTRSRLIAEGVPMSGLEVSVLMPLTRLTSGFALHHQELMTEDDTLSLDPPMRVVFERVMTARMPLAL